MKSGVGQHRVVRERELALVVREAAQDRARRRVDQEDGQQRQGRADEDPRQDPVAPLRLQQADQRADADEQQPDAADADGQGDRRQQDLGDHLVARAVAQVGRARGVAERLVDRGQEVRPALRVEQDEEAGAAQAEADQPGDRQDEARRVRDAQFELRPSHPPPGHSSGARHR